MGNSGSYLKRLREIWGRFWHFFWEEDTLLSWIVNIIVAFVVIKWVVYPFLGLVLGTQYPVVAVVSQSMEHNGLDFEQWWNNNNEWYMENGISRDEFESFPFHNGFNKGDIMVVYGHNRIEVGDVVVFWGGRREPIIHRVVSRWGVDGEMRLKTKGDNNREPLRVYTGKSGSRIKVIDETNIMREDIVGEAMLKIPYLGYIKIWFVKLLQFFHIIN